MTVRRFFQLVGEHKRNFFANWRSYDASFWAKLGLSIRNRTRATFSRAQCCGHAGQPGC